MNLGTKITIYKFTPQVFTLTRFFFYEFLQNIKTGFLFRHGIHGFHGKNKENPRFPCIPCLKKYQASFGIPSLFF